MEFQRLVVLGMAVATVLFGAQPAFAADDPLSVMNPPATAKDWSQLAKLPDWSGIWLPNLKDQFAQMISNPTPWNEKAAPLIKQQTDHQNAGRPDNIFLDCLPEGMPTWMMINHNAMEIAFTPGRIYMFGESDSNRLRRIYTDGRPHPEDPDLTFHGHSIGHWEGDTLVVDTVAIKPQVWLAVGESIGVPNNGDMHVVERIHLKDKDPNTLLDDLTITAPHVLTKPWTTTRVFTRERKRAFDIVEGECLEGSIKPAVDKDGNAIFVSAPRTTDGNRAPAQ